MALLGFDGFEHKSNAVRPGGSSTNIGSFPAGRYGGFCWACGGSSNYAYVVPVLPVVTGAFVTGIAINGMNTAYISVGGGGATHLTLRLGFSSVTNGTDVCRGDFASSTVLATSPPFIMSQSTWYFVEIKCAIADSGGTCIVRVNGVEVINFTGDTRNGGAAQVDFISIGHRPAVGGPSDLFDDWYWLDTTGPAPQNNFLGDVKIETLVPSGAGASAQLTPSAGANWQCMDEQPATLPPTAGADYVSSPTPGQRDTYAHTDLVAASAQVYGVQAQAWAQSSDAGGSNLRCVTRIPSGTVRQGPSTILSSTAGWVMGGIQTTDPDGAPWTIPSVNAAEFGVEVA